MSLDIFSNKKEKEESKINVIIDHREKNSLVPAELKNLGAEIQFSQLQIGDYLVKDNIIERKTLSDLQASIVNRRIFSQIEALKTQDNFIIIVESSNNGWKLHENVFRGFVLSCIKNKIPLIFSKDEKDTAKYLMLIGKESKSESFSFRPHKKLDSKIEITKYILEGFPGVGPVTAEKLMKRFGSIKNIINAEEEKLKEILGKRYTLFKESLE